MSGAAGLRNYPNRKSSRFGAIIGYEVRVFLLNLAYASGY